MTKASDLLNGMCIRFNNELYKVVLAEMKVGTAKLSSSVHVRLRNLQIGTQTEQRLHPEAKVEDVVVETTNLTYSYKDGDTLYFMHPQTFEQVAIPRQMVGAYEKFLTDGSQIKVEFYGVEPVGIELPPTVDLVVKETVPGIKGATASAQVKPATLETGLVIQVPPFVNEGDKVRVSTETGEYQSRA
jgi:elongation factor P